MTRKRATFARAHERKRNSWRKDFNNSCKCQACERRWL